MRWWTWVLGFAAAVVGLALVFHFTQHWLAVHTGTVNESSPYYGFWSGFGADLGYATNVAAVTAAAYHVLRHHNCHQKGCWRLGRPVPGTPFVACHVHHPQHNQRCAERNVPAGMIDAAYREANPS